MLASALEADRSATRQQLHDAMMATDRAITELNNAIFESTDPIS